MTTSFESPAVGAAPAWSLLALRRSGRCEMTAREARIESLVWVGFVPVTIGVACVLLAAASLWGWGPALLWATIGIGIAELLRRSATGRRWRAHADLAALECAAGAERRQLAARLSADQRLELARLEVLVERVCLELGVDRPRDPNAGATEPFVARLDALLVSFVEIATELERQISGFSATVDDVPTEVRTADADDQPESPYARIAALRVAARAQCRRRIAGLRAELTGIGQLVRLVHEQALANRRSPSRDAERSPTRLTDELVEILDGAELERQIREEIEITLAGTETSMPRSAERSDRSPSDTRTS